MPRRLVHPKKKTIGIRVPDHPVALGLLAALGEPMNTTSLRLPGDDLPLSDPEDIRERVGKQLDLVIDSGACGLVPTTVLDLTGDVPEVIRAGLGEFA